MKNIYNYNFVHIQLPLANGIKYGQMNSIQQLIQELTEHIGITKQDTYVLITKRLFYSDLKPHDVMKWKFTDNCYK